MTVEQACQAMIEGRRFDDETRGRLVWITAVEYRGAIELSYGDTDRPRAFWIHLREAEQYGVVA